MTRAEIEPRPTGPLANTLPTSPMSQRGSHLLSVIYVNSKLLLELWFFGRLCMHIYIYIYIYIYMVVISECLSDSKSLQVSRTLLSILADLENIVGLYGLDSIAQSARAVK